MSTVESRHLGPITLDGVGPAVDGAADGAAGARVVDGVVAFGGSPLPVRVEIDHPDRFGEAVVLDIDMVLDNLEFVDGLARDTIAGGLRHEASAPAQLLRLWAQRRLGRESGASEFLDGLRPSHLAILPDGGKANRDRVLMTYSVADHSVSGKITVRFVEPTGPELVPAPRGGFS